jgi:hypothetical protein
MRSMDSFVLGALSRQCRVSREEIRQALVAMQNGQQQLLEVPSLLHSWFELGNLGDKDFQKVNIRETH